MENLFYRELASAAKWSVWLKPIVESVAERLKDAVDADILAQVYADIEEKQAK